MRLCSVWRQNSGTPLLTLSLWENLLLRIIRSSPRKLKWKLYFAFKVNPPPRLVRLDGFAGTEC